MRGSAGITTGRTGGGDDPARKVRQLMLDGVTIEKPETVTTMPRSASDGHGGRAVRTDFGETEIGEDCRIGTAAIVSDSRLGDGPRSAPLP
jgi:bifunctional N-acetylglucosamine-1-phosphate-uridyltransferase/glucosamine-1-phosphate-acetyltransferase GlmU-like protein